MNHASKLPIPLLIDSFLDDIDVEQPHLVCGRPVGQRRYSINTTTGLTLSASSNSGLANTTSVRKPAGRDVSLKVAVVR